ncbi:MAG: hypothetical protein AB7F22_05265 [Reyranella sp.]|uniref:hypothetical protein n=1 Tax=Reyranella sp. TaxID=1929291 RepID=UPI003D0D0A01
MAEFHLWSKESLVKFAEEATAKLAQLQQENDELRQTAKGLLAGWRAEVAKNGASATLPASPKQESLHA